MESPTGARIVRTELDGQWLPHLSNYVWRNPVATSSVKAIKFETFEAQNPYKYHVLVSHKAVWYFGSNLIYSRVKLEKAFWYSMKNFAYMYCNEK